MRKNLLLTGGAGFVGHHLIEYFLKNTDFDIVSLDRLDTSGTINRIAGVLDNFPKEDHRRLKIVWHDLKAQINDYVRCQIGDVNYILHVAAASHVDRSIIDPIGFIMDNVVGTGHILEFARGCNNLELFLNFGTDEVFGPAPEGTWFKDDDRYDCKNPYSATKAGAEELCMSYENTYHLPLVATHTMNIYGTRQHTEKFIPLVIKKVLNNEMVEIHSNEELTKSGKRHYLHSSDLCDAVNLLLEKGVTGNKYNIVANDELENLDLAQKIASILGKELNYKLIDPKIKRPRFDFRYACDGSKLKSLGWEPKIDIMDGLREIVQWYTENSMWLN